MSSRCWFKTYSNPHNAIFTREHTHTHTLSLKCTQSSHFTLTRRANLFNQTYFSKMSTCCFETWSQPGNPAVCWFNSVNFNIVSLTRGTSLWTFLQALYHLRNLLKNTYVHSRLSRAVYSLCLRTSSLHPLLVSLSLPLCESDFLFCFVSFFFFFFFNPVSSRSLPVQLGPSQD